MTAEALSVDALDSQGIFDLEFSIRSDERRLENLRAASDAIAQEISVLSLSLNGRRLRLRDAQAARLAVAA